MAVSLADIKKLREITGAGMMDVKKALEEANGDFETAKDLLRKRGQAIAAKRSDREASEGCVLAKAENGFAAIVALKCELFKSVFAFSFLPKLERNFISIFIMSKSYSFNTLRPEYPEPKSSSQSECPEFLKSLKDV